MCTHTITLSKNINGQLAHCQPQKVYQLHFNNLFLEFTRAELESFKRYVATIDVNFWEACPDRVALSRKIPIPTLQGNLVLMFNQQELCSLKDIIFERTAKPHQPLQTSEVDYLFVLN